MAIYSFQNHKPDLPKNGRYWVADSASVIGDVVLGENSSVWYGATVRGDTATISIGENTNIQDGSVIHADEGVPTSIGKNCTIGHMVMLHGCTLADECLIGIGATVLNGAKIGKHCIIGAHALIPEGKEIPDGSVVMGMPGKVVKTLTEEERSLFLLSAAHYVENWQKHKMDCVRLD